MKDIVKKLRYILDRKQKINICFLGVMILIGGNIGGRHINIFYVYRH